MDLKLISDFLLVRVLDDAPDPSGILSPYGRHASEPQRAEVLAAGPGYRSPNGDVAPMPCISGDIVLLQFNAGTEVRMNGETLRFVPARDLFGVEVP